MDRIYLVLGLMLVQVLWWEVVQCNQERDSNTKPGTRSVVDVARVRRDDLPTVHVETAILVDEDYIRYLQGLGHSTEEKMTEIIRLKMNGAQAEFGKADIFGYHIYIDIKLVEFWYTNPDWYQPSAVLDRTLYSVCFGAEGQGLYTTFDFIHLFTGLDNPDVSGKAYTGKVCDAKRKCAVSARTRVTEYVIPTHELGHSLGMSHDVDVGCPSPDDGIMGSKTSGWSNCSITSTQELLRDSVAACLFETNNANTTVLPLTAEWPGMTYTDDEICELYHGAGFVYRPFPYTNWGECALHSCWNMTTSSAQSGRFYTHYFPTDGRYCGPGQVCSSLVVSGSYRCISWEETGLSPGQFVVVEGGWSTWGEWSVCGRTCGTGVRYRQRACNNPRPKNSPGCSGLRYDAVLCNTQPCVNDESDERSLIRQRAREVCTVLQTTQWYGSDTPNYLPTGDRYHHQGDGQCEVRCDTVTGYTPLAYQRYGIMPDGTACSSSTETSFVDKHRLPRRTGYTYHCIEGHCLRFDCAGTTDGDRIHDNCGRCDGDSTTCDLTQSIYNTTLQTYESGTIIQLPPEAFLIQFYFVYGNMDTYLMELWTTDGKPIISPFDTGIYKTVEVEAVNLAGTTWHYDFEVQYLYADGPINESVIVKVICYKTKENKGIYYSYSTPKDTGVAVGENCTNTFCSDINAVCNDESICTCKPGLYYNTTMCIDKDECSGDDHVCIDVTSGGECINTVGSYTCGCRDGFTGDGTTSCEDKDECSGDDPVCIDVISGGECINTVGSYTCGCRDGFTGDGTTMCKDKDECSGDDHVCIDVTSGGECINTVGSYTCGCRDGFTGDGTTYCEDIDECSVADLNGCVPSEEGGVCINLNGTYTCGCDTGNSTAPCKSPLDSYAVVTFTVGTAVNSLVIVVVFLHGPFQLFITRTRPSIETVFSSTSTTTCGTMLLGEVIFMLGVNQLLTDSTCEPLSILIQISSIGYFTVVGVELWLVWARLHGYRRGVTWATPLLLTGLTVVSITVLTAVTRMEGFVLPGRCWYDRDHAVFTATSVIIGVSITGICFFGIMELLKISTLTKKRSSERYTRASQKPDTNTRKDIRFLRCVVRQSLVCVPCHGVVWAVRVAAINSPTPLLTSITLIVLIIEGLVIIFSRLYINRCCRPAKSNPKTRDVDHLDASKAIEKNPHEERHGGIADIGDIHIYDEPHSSDL